MLETNHKFIAIGHKVQKIKHLPLGKQIHLYESISDLLKVL